MKGVVVDDGAPARLAVGEIEEPVGLDAEALVRVEAVSLNRGEVRRAQTDEAGHRPGWDLAGTVERAAPDGSGPAEGARVVGLMHSGAWAERAAVPTSSLAELPDAVTFTQASTLPVAGLTALYALDKARGIVGRNVLVTGASGGAGHFAIQLARRAGAHVVGLVRRAEHRELVTAAGAHEIAVSEDASAASPHGPYDVVIDAVGGAVLGDALGMLAPNATCVVFGATAAMETTFDLGGFFRTGGATLYGFFLFHEVLSEPAASGLARLARMVADGSLTPEIGVEASIDEVGKVAKGLLDRGFTGKAVLHL